MGRSVSRSSAVARSMRRVSRYRCGGTPKASLNERAKWASETPLTRASRRTGHVLVRGGVHPVLRAQQAPQQLGILANGALAQHGSPRARSGVSVSLEQPLRGPRREQRRRPQRSGARRRWCVAPFRDAALTPLLPSGETHLDLPHGPASAAIVGQVDAMPVAR